MGSPVSAVVAKLYTKFFEGLAFNAALARPRIWKRYLDDTFSVMKKGDVDGLLNHLNRIRLSIKFTMELEENGSIPFLDTRVTRKVERKFDITVYRNPCTRTGTYTSAPITPPTSRKDW